MPSTINTVALTLFAFVLSSSIASLHDRLNEHERIKHTTRGIHLPILRQERQRLRKRDGQTGTALLGDYLDV
jgi:hypothetical protein